MGIYSCWARIASATINVDNTIVSIWNPSSTKVIKLYEFIVTTNNFLANRRQYLARISTRGTPASTVTPTATNAFSSNKDPASGALIDLGLFSVEPTKAAKPIMAIAPAGLSGTLQHYHFNFKNGIIIKPSNGFAFVAFTNHGASTFELVYLWEEMS